MKPGPKPRPAVDRVLARVDRATDGCWLFTGALSLGYGEVTVGSASNGTRRPEKAHRVVYEALVGPLPPGYDLHHVCGVRRCVNPEHLALLAHDEHAHKHAHELCKRCGSDDWYFAPSGYRRCRECRRIRRRGVAGSGETP